MPKKIKLDMTKKIKELEAKDKANKYWGTAGAYGGSVNISDKH